MIHPEIPRLALSILNPWGWLVAVGLKQIENRDQNFTFRGKFAIHAGKNFDSEARETLSWGGHPVTGRDLPEDPAGLPSYMPMMRGELSGGIIGVAEVVDVVTQSEDDWFVGRYGLVIRNARLVPFIPVGACPDFSTGASASLSSSGGRRHETSSLEIRDAGPGEFLKHRDSGRGDPARGADAG